jgi:hypothetical protein
MSSGIFGVVLNQQDYLQGTVVTGGQLIGWEYMAEPSSSYCWSFRRSAAEFYDAAEAAGALTIKGLPDNSAAALIRWNNVPMTDEELDQIERDEGRMLNGIANPLATGYSLNDLRRAALLAQGYSGDNNGMVIKWLLDNGADATGPQHINDLWRSFLIFQGFTPALDYQYNDAFYAFLGAQGYTNGDRNGREIEFWRAGGVIT